MTNAEMRHVAAVLVRHGVAESQAEQIARIAICYVDRFRKQRPCDVGLFSDDSRQTGMFDK